MNKLTVRLMEKHIGNRAVGFLGNFSGGEGFSGDTRAVAETDAPALDQ